jgi:hypothetical protein
MRALDSFWRMLIIKSNNKKLFSERISIWNIVQSKLRLIETTKLHGLSPRSNYIDRATAACRRQIPYGRNLGFIDRSKSKNIKIKGITWLVGFAHRPEF